VVLNVHCTSVNTVDIGPFTLKITCPIFYLSVKLDCRSLQKAVFPRTPKAAIMPVWLSVWIHWFLIIRAVCFCTLLHSGCIFMMDTNGRSTHRSVLYKSLLWLLIDQCLVICIVEPVICVQARMGAGVWSQFVLEVSESTELFDSQVTRNNWSTETLYEIINSLYIN